MADAKEVAAGLTKAQRRWMTGQGAGSRCTKRLQELGLIKRYGVVWWEMTDMGLAVRAILEQEKSDA